VDSDISIFLILFLSLPGPPLQLARIRLGPDIFLLWWDGLPYPLRYLSPYPSRLSPVRYDRIEPGDPEQIVPRLSGYPKRIEEISCTSQELPRESRSPEMPGIGRLRLAAARSLISGSSK
jgi:hypothetical protein